MVFTEEQLNSFEQDPINTPKDNSAFSLTEEQIDTMDKESNRQSSSMGAQVMPGINPSEFDFTLKGGDFDNFLYRAQDQPWGTQLMNGVAKAIINTPLDIISNVASILDIEDYYNQDNEVGNDIVRSMNEAKEGVEEAFPIYRQNEGAALDVGDPAWWFQNGSGILSSALSFAATGFGTGAVLSKGAKALQWVAKARGAVKTSGAIASAAEVLVPAANILALNQAEGMLTAVELYDETFKQATKQGFSEEDAKRMSASAAAHSINVNRANIALNITSVNAFTKGFSKGMTRQILKKEALGKTIALESAQEYAEEVVNLYAEKEGKRQADYALLGKHYDAPSTAGERMINTIFSLEGFEAGLLGAVGGAAQTGFTHLGRNVGINGKSKNAEINKRIADQKAFISELDTKLKDSGAKNYYTAMTSLENVKESIEERDSLLKSANEYTARGEEVPSGLAHQIQIKTDEILLDQSVANFKQGTTAILEKGYQELASMTPDEAKERGFTGEQLDEKSPAYYKTQAERAVKKINEYERIYNQHYNYKNIGGIMANRVAVEATKEALVLSTAETSELLPKAIETNETLPLYGVKERPAVEDFERLHKTGSPNQKRYITNARKKRGIKAYTDAIGRNIEIAESIVTLDKTYKKQTSLKEQRLLRDQEKQREQDKKDTADAEKVNSEANKQLAESQDNVADQADAINIPEAPVNNTAIVTEGAEGDVQPEVEGLQGYTGPEVETEDAHLSDEERAILAEAQAEVQGEIKEEIADILSDVRKENNEANQEHLEDSQEAREAEKEVGYQANDEVDNTANITTIQQKLKDENVVESKAFSIGYLAEDLNGDLNSEVNPIIFDYDKINVGTKVTLMDVSDTYTGNVYHNGEKVPWQGLKSELTTEQGVGKFPIAIVHEGQTIGFVHDAEWFNEDNIGKASTVSQEVSRNLAVREAIIKKGEISTVIDFRGNGMFPTTPETKPVATNLPGVKIAVIKNNQLSDYKDLNIINRATLPNGKRLKNGHTIAVIPVNKGEDGKTQYIGVPLLRQELNPQAKQSIIQAITIMMKNRYFPESISEAENQIVTDIEEQVDFNIKTADGLKDYINLFTHTTIGEDFKNLEEFMLTQNENRYVMDITPYGASFGKGGKPVVKDKKNVLVPFMFQSAPNEYLEGLENIVNHLYAHVNDNLLETDVTIPIINDKGEVETLFTGSYTDYIAKYALHTDITAHNIGTEESPEYVNTVQAIITYDSSFADVADLITPASSTVPTDIDENMIAGAIEKAEIEAAKEAPKDIPTPPKGMEKFFKGLNPKSFESNQDIGEETEELFAPFSGEITSDYIVSTLSSTEQSLLITNILANVIENVSEDDNLLKSVESSIDYFATNIMPGIKNEAWKLKKVARVELQNFISTTIQNEDEAKDTTEASEEERSIEERDVAWGTDLLTVNPKDKLSSRLKRLFAFTPELDLTTDKELTTKQGLTVYAGPDKVYNTIMGILAENFNRDERAPQTFKEMMEVLDSFKSTYPFLANIVDKLESAPRQLQNEFMVNADKHYVQMYHVRKGFSTKKGMYFNVLEDNANSRKETIKALWRHNNLFRAAISDDLRPNMDVVTGLIAEYDSWIAKGEFEDGKVLNWLSKMGITITQDTLNAFKDNENPVEGVEYVNHFLVNKGIFYNFRQNLENLGPATELLESDLYTKDAISRLANQEAKYNAMYVANLHRSGNNNIYGFQEHKYASKRTADLKYDEEILARLAKDPATKDLSWIKALGKLDADGNFIINKESRFYKNFRFSYIGLGALIDADSYSRQKKKLSELSAKDHEEVKMGMFHNKYTADARGNRTVQMFFPTMSDKSKMFTTTVEALNVTYNSKGELSTTTINKLFESIVMSELNRMNNFNPDKENIVGYEDGAMMFYSVPELNNVEGIFTQEGNIKKINPKALITGEIENKLLKDAFKEHLDQTVTNQLQDWINLGIYNPDTKVLVLDNQYDEKYLVDKAGIIAEDKAKLAAADYSLNYMLANANIQNLFAGDIAQYHVANPRFKEDHKDAEGTVLHKKGELIPETNKTYYTEIAKNTFVNVGKRLAQLSGPRRSPVIVDNETTYIQGFLADKLGISLSIEYLDELFRDNPEAREAYRKIMTTDAQEFITVFEKIKNLYGDGKIDQADYKKLLAIARAGTDFSPSDLAKLQVFQVDKPLYSGSIYGDNSKVGRQLYIKSSAVTLLPQFTRGLEIDKLRVLMENKKNPVDRVAFSSAVKVGNVITPLDIWTEDGIANDLTFNDLQTLTLNRADYGIQQEIPHKDSETIKRVSQAAKLAFVNILEEDGFELTGSDKPVKGKVLQTEYLDNWKTLYKVHSEELFEELEIDATADVLIPNPQKLKKILQEEAEKRNLSLQDIEGLELLEDGSFELPLWAHAGGKQFEALLSSLIGNKVLQQKMPGKAYVLATEEGIKKSIVTLEEFGNTSEIAFIDSNFTQLKPSTEVAGTITNSGIIIPWPFKGVPMSKYLNPDGTIDMSKIDKDLLKMYGMRIPNQGPNSTANLRVAGFLPEVMGDIIIAPRDFITQMGSDFDVDKLYTYMYNHIVDEKGSITRVTEDSIDEKALERRVEKLERTIAETALLDMSKDRKYKLKLLNAELQQVQKYLEPNALTKVQAQDKIVEIHRAINSNPSELVQKQIRTPLGEGSLGEHARTVEHARSKNDFFSPYSPTYQRTKFKNAATGNAAIGVFAIANTFNALIQAVEDDVTMFDGKEPLEIAFGDQKSEGKLNRIRTLDKKGEGSTFISNNISDYVSASVDNEKLQILHNLNINDLTYGVVGLLNQLGFTQDVVSSFMSQDIIFDVVEEVDKLRSQGVSIANSLEVAFEEVAKRKEYIDEAFDSLDEKTQEQKIRKASIAGHKTLFDVIKKGEAHEDYKIIQRATLAKFQLLYSKGTELSTLQRATNIDSSGLGKNLIESSTKEEAIVNILTKSPINNARSLFGKIIDPGFNAADIERAKENPNNIQLGKIFFEPTTIAGFAVAYGLFPNNRIWNQSKYFPYTLKSVNDVMDVIINNSNIREFEEFRNAEVKGRIFNGIKSYLFSDMSNLGFVDPSLNQDSARLARFNLLGGKGVLQSYVVDYENSTLFRENPFLNKLSVRKRKRGTPASINFDSRIEDNAGKLNVYTGLIKLLNSTKQLPDNMIIDSPEVQIKTEQDLARALIAAQYASGGIQKFTQFLRYIPLDYLKNIGFNQKIRETDFANLLNEGAGQNKYTLPHFVIQFFQHNTTLLPSPAILVEDFISKDKEKEEDISEFTVPLPEDPKEHWKIKPMLKLKGKNGFNPFLFDGSKYVRLDKLGGVDFNEYQKGEVTRSLIYDNIAWNNSYYDQVASNTSKSEAQAKAEKINHLTLDDKYGFTNSELSISNTLNKIANNGPADYQALAQDLAQVFAENDYTLVINRSLPIRGRHIAGSKQLIINPDNLNGDSDYAKTFLHETIHMLTNDVLTNPQTEVQKAAKASLNRLFKSYQKTLKPGELTALKEKIKAAKTAKIAPMLTEDEISRVYPAVSLKEFVAGFMTDATTQKHLNEVKFSGEVTYGEEYEKRLLKILKSIKGFQLQSSSAQAMRDVISLLDYNQDTTKDSPVVLSKIGNSTSNNIDNIKAPEKKAYRHSTEDVGVKLGKTMAQVEASFLGVEADIEAQIESAIESSIPMPTEADFSKSLPKDDPTTFEDLPAIAKKEKVEKTEEINPMVRNKKNIIQDLHRKIARDTKKLHEADNPTVGVYFENRINRSYDKIRELEQEIADIESISTYEQTLETGKQDLAYVDTILSSDKALITDEDMQISGRIIDLWKNFQKTPFVADIYKKLDTTDDFNILKNKAEALEDRLHDISVEKTQDFIRRELATASPSDIEKIMEAADDIGMVSSYIYDIGRADHLVLQAIAKAIMKANNRTTEEVSKIADEVDPKLQAAEKALKEQGLDFDIFQQKDEKGRATGRLVMAYSQKYYDTVKRNSKKAFAADSTKEDKKTFREWQELTQIVINPAKLTDAKYLSSIEKEVGAGSLAYVKQQALKQQHYYKEAKAREEVRLKNDIGLTPEQRETNLALWEAKYNPEIAASKKGAVDVKGVTVWPSPTYTVSVPRKVNTKGEETGFYDENFATIQSNPALKEFHDYTMNLLETLSNYTPYTKDPVNTIPLMQKSFWEASQGENAQTIFNLMSSAMKKASRAKGATDNYVMDDYTEGRMLANNLNQVMKANRAARMEVKRIQYKQTEGKEPAKKLEKEWFKDITNDIVKESSFDLGKILKTYAATAIAYKHKSQIETPLRIAEQLLKDVQVNKRSSSGAIINHAEGQASDKGLENMVAMLESTLDTFFGKPKTERILKQAKKNYTTEEKAKKVELETIVTTAEANLKALDEQYNKGEILKDNYNKARAIEQAHIETATKQLDKLGGSISLIKASRGILQYTQLIGMGWNIVAGMANLGFGQMSNIIEGSGGEHYSMKQLWEATGTVIRSTIAGVKTQEGKKISKLMKRWGVLQKSSNEMFEQKTAKNRILNLLNPYKPQDTTEYINQAPLMVVYQKKTPVLDAEGNPMIVNGEEVNFYNAYDEEGEWREDILGVKESASHIQSQKDDLKINIGDMIKRNHGNYDSRGSHLRIKDSVLGQALTQFRTWMFEGFGNRFRKEYEDRITGTTKKGRYVTIYEDLGRALKLLYSKGTWGELSEVDRANARKTLMEMSMYLSLWGFVAALKGVAEDEDDEEQLAVMNTLINLSLRMQTDIAFYINPADFEHLTQSTIPAMSLITNFGNLADAMYKYIQGEDELLSGVHAGDSRLLQKASKIAPFGAAMYKGYNIQSQIFDQ